MTGSAAKDDHLFGDDYLYFFADELNRKSEADTDQIWHLLELKPQMHVLDLGCGHGRIANRLARLGCRVTGLDPSLPFLRRAREEAAALGVQVDYVRADMRDLPWTGRFDRVVSWANAFGFFDDAEDRSILARIAETLQPSGRLLVETNNYPRYIRDYRPSVVAEREGNLVIDQHHLDPLTSRSIATRTIVRDGQLRRSPSSHRVHTFPELRDWLRAAGFATVEGYGEDGRLLTADHRRLLAVAQL
jgi:2-polyprenyl-3-methyl-5-hydroxy-6-metoxy-1,4-benzoquinol methylase